MCAGPLLRVLAVSALTATGGAASGVGMRLERNSYDLRSGWKEEKEGERQRERSVIKSIAELYAARGVAPPTTSVTTTTLHSHVPLRWEVVPREKDSLRVTVLKGQTIATALVLEEGGGCLCLRQKP